MTERTTTRDAARVGIGGPVGSGKTRLIERLVGPLRDRGVEVAVITNDLVTKEDAERLRRLAILPPELIVGVETGGCPHTAIREDPSMNLAAVDGLQAAHGALDLILIESGGDNLAATFSSELADLWIFVIDVAAGDDIPRKRGLGLLQADLVVVNKTDLAPLVGADLDLMARDLAALRRGRPNLFTDLRQGDGVQEVVEFIVAGALFDRPVQPQAAAT
jgi:urease accessory protein